MLIRSGSQSGSRNLNGIFITAA